MPSRVDPALSDQIDAARKTGKPVNAVVRLRRTAGKAPEPAKIEAETDAAVRRASAATGDQPRDVHVLGRMAVAYVSGSAAFVRELIAQPEVSGAVANEAAG